MSDFADIVAQWRAAGILPDGVERKPSVPLDSAAIIREQRMERFRGYCPEEFREKIDRTRIPNLAAWDEADQWAGTYPGIFIWSHGTGFAKSRMLWRKFGQLHVERGLSVLRVTGMNLAEDYHDHFNRSKTADFYRGLLCVDVVMLDDLDKMPLPNEGLGYAEHAHADRNARMLREVFDRFYENHVAALVTANESITWFAERIGPSGERRMREACKEIAF